MNVAFYEAASSSANLQIDDVSIVPCANIQNYGFETGDLSGWTAIGTSYGVDGSDVYQGNYKCYFWNSGSFTQKIEQTVAGIPNGAHMVTAWAKQNSSAPTACRMELSNYGGPTVYSDIPYSSGYMQIFGLIYMTNGQLNISFYEEGTGTNLQIDNVVVY